MLTKQESLELAIQEIRREPAEEQIRGLNALLELRFPERTPEAQHRIAELRALALGRVEMVVVEEHTIETSFGWVFFYTSKQFLETRLPQYWQAGNAPLIVNKYTGTIERCPTYADLRELLEDLEKRFAEKRLKGDGHDVRRSLDDAKPPEPKWIYSNDITDDDLAELKDFRRLRYLELDGRKGITDAGIVHVAALSDLEILDLSYTAVSDAGLRALQGLIGLRELRLRRTSITDAATSVLGELTGLEGLDLSETRIGDETLAAIAALPTLMSLKIVHCAHVSDAGMEHVAKLSKLYNLFLAFMEPKPAGVPETPVTENGILRLKGMRRLPHLFIRGFSEESLARMRRELPDCQIHHYPREAGRK